ncbi:MAG: hypothetical protein HOB73_16635 [Planctomycetaceae bacterium]|jgi:hypothetical protein|nr:hypothetical protein [Planctomycetaceae bacterium]
MNNDIKNVSANVNYAKPAIWHPVVDFLLVGGASIIGGIALIVCFTNNPEWAEQFDRYADNGSFKDLRQFWLFWILTLVISFPHLLASYRIQYRSKAQINKYRWSSIYVPCILLTLCIATLFAIVTPVDVSQDVQLQFEAVVNSSSGLATYVFAGLTVINVVYLGWHYNLQGWRMTAAFADLHGVCFSSREQRMIKSGFLAMVFTHAVLFLGWTPLIKMEVFNSCLPMLVLVLPIIGGAAFVLGGLGFYGANQRTGKRIPINAMTPWAASFFWYYLVTQYHYVFGIVVVVQLAHALQYLSFSSRIERNLQFAKNPRASAVKPIFLILALILCGYFVFVVPGPVIKANNWSVHLLFAFNLLVIAINIHHCFIDGEIWKSSNSEMQQTLFSHLKER